MNTLIELYDERAIENILAPDIYGGYNSFTGTSFATPIVTASVALLVEWGIVRGNDLFLYGEKLYEKNRFR